MTISNQYPQNSNSTQASQASTTSAQVAASASSEESQPSESKPVTKAPEVPYQRFIDQLNQSYQDRVSLSPASRQLQRISSEFFSGTLRSDQIPALTTRLYEQGFLSPTEFKQLGGNEAKVSTITRAVRFIDDQIEQQTSAGNSEDAAELKKVLNVLNNIDLPSTEQRRREEKEAYEYVAKSLEELKESGDNSSATKDKIKGLEETLKVLAALDSARKTESSTGALTSYASVQQAHDDLFTAENQ